MKTAVVRAAGHTIDLHMVERAKPDHLLAQLKDEGRPRRTDTEALMRDVEIIPRRKVPYKGVWLEESEIDIIVDRDPQICLSYERAHTNVPGSKHEKRYQDVLEQLDHGSA